MTNFYPCFYQNQNRELETNEIMLKETKLKERLLGDGLFVDLEDVNGHSTGGGELLVADVALEVLSLLMLNKNLLVVEFSVAVIAPNLRRYSLLLLPHYYCYFAEKSNRIGAISEFRVFFQLGVVLSSLELLVIVNGGGKGNRSCCHVRLTCTAATTESYYSGFGYFSF